MTDPVQPPITGATRLYCIIGHPVAPLRSPAFFNAAFRRHGIDAVFVALDIDLAAAEAGFAGLRAMRNIDGIVVTMPLKQRVLPLLDEVLPHARAVGAVNSIRRMPDGRLVGDMFDGKGGVLGLRWEGHEPRGRRVLLVDDVLTTGASLLALAQAARAAGAASVYAATMARTPT